MTDTDFEEVVYDFEKPKHDNYIEDDKETEEEDDMFDLEDREDEELMD